MGVVEQSMNIKKYSYWCLFMKYKYHIAPDNHFNPNQR